MIKSSLVGRRAGGQAGGIGAGIESRGMADTNTKWLSGQTWTAAG